MILPAIVVANIIGAYAVAKNNSLAANQIWSVTNPILASYNLVIIKELEMGLMFAVYTLIAWFGLYRWYAKRSV